MHGDEFARAAIIYLLKPGVTGAGVDMPNRRELVAHNLTEDQVCEVLGADGLIYQTVEDLIETGYEMNPSIERFDASCFDADYITGDVDEAYLLSLENAGRGKTRNVSGLGSSMLSQVPQ